MLRDPDAAALTSAPPANDNNAPRDAYEEAIARDPGAFFTACVHAAPFRLAASDNDDAGRP